MSVKDIGERIPAFDQKVKESDCNPFKAEIDQQGVGRCQEDPDRRITVVSFSLPEDRDLMLSGPFKKAYAKLSLSSAKRRAVATYGKDSATLRKEFVLNPKYISMRLFYDEPGGGLLVIQSTKEGSVLTGLLMYNEFATWEAGLTFPGERGHISDQIASLRVVQNEDHWTTPRLCELSVLLGLGTGKYLMSLFLNHLEKKQDKYFYLVTDALKTASTFYSLFGFTSIASVRNQGNGKFAPYFHYRYAGEEALLGDEASNFMARPVWEWSYLLCDEVLD